MKNKQEKKVIKCKESPDGCHEYRYNGSYSQYYCVHCLKHKSYYDVGPS